MMSNIVNSQDKKMNLNIRPNEEESSKSQQQGGLMEKVRDTIHEKVATKEQLYDEKPRVEKLKETMPSDTKEAVDMAKSGVTSAIDDVKEKFNERIDEGTPREQLHHENKKDGSDKGLLQKQIGEVKNSIYEATKSPDVKEREEFEKMPIVDRLKHLHEKSAGGSPDAAIILD